MVLVTALLYATQARGVLLVVVRTGGRMPQDQHDHILGEHS